MDPAIQRALETDRVIDITTIGRRSGEQRRKEMWCCNVDGTVYLSGRPGRRGWYANLLASPAFTFHLKQSVEADPPAVAVPITDPDERQRVIEAIIAGYGGGSVDEWVADSPLVRVELGESAGARGG